MAAHDLDCPCCCPDPRRFGRREGMRAALAGLACAAVPSAHALAAGAERALRVRRVQTGETFAGAYWRDGRYDREALRRLDVVFRDPSAGAVTPMDPRLFDVLFSVAQRLDAAGQAFEVISGYRTPATNAMLPGRVSSVSLHMSGMASDLRLTGRDSFGLARTAAIMQVGGVGLYRRDGFVHLDCGPVRRW